MSASEGRGLRLEPRGADGEIDGGVIRHVEKQELGRGGDQRPFEMGGQARQALVEQLAQSRANGAKTAQRDGRDRAREGNVARIEASQSGGNGSGRKTLFEGMGFADDVAEDGGGGEARGKPGMLLGFQSRGLRGAPLPRPIERAFAIPWSVGPARRGVQTHALLGASTTNLSAKKGRVFVPCRAESKTIIS